MAQEWNDYFIDISTNDTNKNNPLEIIENSAGTEQPECNFKNNDPSKDTFDSFND